MTILPHQPKARKIAQILANPNTPLGNLIQQTEQLQRLNRVFHHTLDLELATHCQVAKLTAQQLSLAVENAAWATRLRYAIPDILKLLRTQPEFHTVEKIRYKIAAPTHQSPQPPPSKKDPAAMRQARKLKQLASTRSQVKK